MRVSSKFKRAFLAVIAIGAALFTPFGAQAQTVSTWEGCDVDTLKSSTRFLLYNVGTGKFIMQGGEWGTEAILYLQDYGAPCTLAKNQGSSNNLTWIEASVSTETGAHTIGCNVLNYSSGNQSYQTHNAILDAHGEGSFGNTNYTRTWTFERVHETDGTYTYNLRETITRSGGYTGDGNFYLGAVWGTNGYKGPNKTAYKDASNTVVLGTVADSANYQWRLVSEKEFESVQTASSANTFGGLNANVSYSLRDPFFDRSQNTFNGAWTVQSKAGDVENSTVLRKDWTRDNGTNTMVNPGTFTVLPSGASYTTYTDKDGKQYTDESNGLYNTPWNDAVFRKLEPASWSGEEYHRDWAQYEMATLEGEGVAYQTVKFTRPGSYMLTARAFTNGDAKGYLYVANADGTNEVTSPVGSGTPLVPLWSKGSAYGGKSPSYHTAVSASANWVKVAKYLDDKTDLTVGLLFTVPDGATEDTPVSLRIGLKKTGAVKNDYTDFDANRTINNVSASRTWGHDTTYVAIDNMQLHYLGKDAPFVFNENKVSDSYMRSDITDQTKTAGGKLTNRTIYLKRNAAINCWQPIILPITLSTEQLRTAFGDDVRLGELAGVGKVGVNSPTSIDFKLVKLTPGEVALHAGKFYLIRATHAPGYAEWTENGVSNSGDFYALGRHDYDPTVDLGNGDYTNAEGTTNTIGASPFYQKISGTAWNGTSTRDPFTNEDLTIHATWIKTPSSETNSYVPAHAYVVQDGNMYYLSSAMRILGFKWWITAPESAQAKGLAFNFINPSEVITYIDGISSDRRPQTEASTAVYNLAGERVANDASALQNLPSGIYITNGKKIFKR